MGKFTSEAANFWASERQEIEDADDGAGRSVKSSYHVLSAELKGIEASLVVVVVVKLQAESKEYDGRPIDPSSALALASIIVSFRAVRLTHTIT